MASSETTSCFHIFFTGQIESLSFPLGPDASEVFCRYELVAGADWELISGQRYGITQSVINKNACRGEIVLNMPIDSTYSSTNPFGWPQILLCIYGRNKWGIEISLGYCRVHMPTPQPQSDYKILAPIVIPKATNMLGDVYNWLTSKNPELKNPKILTEGSKNKVLITESHGIARLRLNAISRGSTRLGYDWNRPSQN